VRSNRRLDPLPEDGREIVAAGGEEPDPDQPRFVGLVQQALGAAMAALDPRDRLRLGFYYAQELTLAQTGRLLGEHEATVSRHLSRTRRLIRDFVEAELGEAGLTPEQVDRAFELAMADAGDLDLSRMVVAERKDPALDRST
jgi:DNA-directed RNA polymerase specialized sigma24 family protein